MSSVLVILTCFRRPGNLPALINVFGQQTVPVKILVVDNSPPSSSFDGQEANERYPRGCLADAGDVWRIGRNLGPPCRLAPAFMLHHEHDYILFCDDDLLPGRQCVESLLTSAAAVGDQFATIGQIGRRFRGAPRRGWRYVAKNIPRFKQHLTPCDMTCRAHFVRADLLPHVLQFRQELLRQFPADECREAIGIHDDLLLCLGIQRATSLPSFVNPSSLPVDAQIITRELNDQHGVSLRRSHRHERKQIINWASAIGWQSLWRDRYVKMLNELPNVDICDDIAVG